MTTMKLTSSATAKSPVSTPGAAPASEPLGVLADRLGASHADLLSRRSVG